MRFANANGDSNCHIHSDGNPFVNAYANTNGNCYCNGDGDGTFANTDSNSHCDCNSNAYAITDGNCDCDRTAAAYTDATASADTAASPLAFFVTTGTRENKLASSQPPEDELRWMNSLQGKADHFPASRSANRVSG